MKNFCTSFSVIATMLVASPALANADSTANFQKQNESLQIYRRAIAYSDLSTAAYALVSYLHAGGNQHYNDSLAIIYFNMNNLPGAYKLANELYAANNKNIVALTLLADITGRGKETKASLEWYEKLCVQSPSPYNHYQLATKQFLLERKMECMETLQKVVADSAAALKQPVSLEISPGSFEEVPVSAAAYNMMGVLALKDGKKDTAMDFYRKAITIAPDFVIAKQNLGNAQPAATPSKSNIKGPGSPKTKG